MRTHLIPIGNSRGIRIPKALLQASGLESEVELELQGRSLILKAPENPRMDWEAAFAKESLGPPSEEEREWEALSNQFDENEWQWE